MENIQKVNNCRNFMHDLYIKHDPVMFNEKDEYLVARKKGKHVSCK
jgi:hypothetical protein